MIEAVDIVQGRHSVALVGLPNGGKTTLFNAITGERMGVGNWPGTSVDVEHAKWRDLPDVEIYDLPGAYSLEARGPDEQLAHDVMLGQSSQSAPDAVVVVTAAGNLPRGLYLLAELRERPQSPGTGLDQTRHGRPAGFSGAYR